MLTRVLPEEMAVKAMRQAKVDAKLADELLKLDECAVSQLSVYPSVCLSHCVLTVFGIDFLFYLFSFRTQQGNSKKTYKIGVLSCENNQETEEEMYGSPSCNDAMEP